MSAPNIDSCVALALTLKPKQAPYYSSRAGQAAKKNRGRGSDQSSVSEKPQKQKLIRIVAKLHPGDLLRLARASRHFRSMLMTRRSRHLWVASFENVSPGLPKCPYFIPEPRYAAVLFDQYCFACGVERSTQTDYGHFVRLCAPCYKHNFPNWRMIGTSLSPGCYPPELPAVLIAVADHGLRGTLHGADSSRNSENSVYYQPELEAVTREWNALRDTNRCHKYLEERRAYAAQMQQNAYAVSKWVCDNYVQKRSAEDAAREDRKSASVTLRHRILEKLARLGYGPADYPDNDAWKKILDRPTRLTDRIWKMIRPKLEVLIEQKRDDDRRAAFEARLKDRRDEFKPLYDAFVEHVLTGDDHDFAPSWHDACLLPCIVELTTRSDASQVVTEARVVAILDRLIAEVNEYTCRAKRDLLEMVHREEHERQRRAVPPMPPCTMQVIDAELAKGSSLFICHRCPLKTALSARDICKHWRIEHSDLQWNDAWPIDELFDRRRKRSEWPKLLPWVCAMQAGAHHAKKALEVLGLPEDSSHAMLDQLVKEGRLICRCGSPKLRPSSECSWAVLIHHVAEEISWYAQMSDILPRFHGAKSPILNDHSLSGATPCLRLLAKGEQATFPDYSVPEDVRAEVSDLLDTHTAPPTCASCYYTVRDGSRFNHWLLQHEKDVDVLAHHLRTSTLSSVNSDVEEHRRPAKRTRMQDDAHREEETPQAVKKAPRKRKADVPEHQPEDFTARAANAWKIGPHVSAAGGVENAIINAAAVGANAFAIFLKSQRKWDSSALQDKSIQKFKERMKAFGYSPAHILPHGSYLVNLGNPDQEKRDKSYECFLDDLKRCEQLGLQLYNFQWVFHHSIGMCNVSLTISSPGSTVGAGTLEKSLSLIADCINRAHKKTDNVIIVLENMASSLCDLVSSAIDDGCQAGSGNVIGSRFSELGEIIRQVEDKTRVGVCLDTCHMYAAGYDITTRKGWQITMEEFDREVGMSYLRGMHLNDSKAPLSSKKDRHENIGLGHLGLRTFVHILADPRTRDIPLILETPAYDVQVGSSAAARERLATEGMGVWRTEVAVLNGLSGRGEKAGSIDVSEEELEERRKEIEEAVRKASKLRDAKGKKADGRGASEQKSKRKRTEDEEDGDEDGGSCCESQH
ncbi:hypothetical protein BN946_scf184747.g34 [Trametes cinnabarina]|uniref:Apurinic-apyrimidinic endonuclease 1 n=1 Tax=Pycnoporus cinnabarinus TaxID=5643 RepID=A0A060SST3_PYCCI|nr:hypothetical protein BN946_scf184747.g34 [Trametes cinnabarina]